MLTIPERSHTARMAVSRPVGLPQPSPPLSLSHALYSGGVTPRFSQMTGLLSSSPTTKHLRGVPLSPTSSGFTSPVSIDSSPGNQNSPPLEPTTVLYNLQTADGQLIRPEIFGRIDKGFFMADNDWTCYRRNYFSLNCSYTLHPAIPTGTLHVVQGGNSHSQVYNFAISIAAVVDGREGKPIELVQHTPKRDKGPQERPSRITLAPRPPPVIGLYSGNDNGLGDRARTLYDQGYPSNSSDQIVEATFERIQFKNATANNGKRRAAQQYYHLIVELFADVGHQGPERWIKIATRMSAPMVVRGRSPGHYQTERRDSNASTGPGSGAGGGGAANLYSPNDPSSRMSGDVALSGSSVSSLSGYGQSFDGHSHHRHDQQRLQQQHRSSISSMHIPVEQSLSPEDTKGIDESSNYMYYTTPLWEETESRFLPNVIEHQSPKYRSGGSSMRSLPSMAGYDKFGQHCRWSGIAENRSYLPTATPHRELNMS